MFREKEKAEPAKEKEEGAEGTATPSTLGTLSDFTHFFPFIFTATFRVRQSKVQLCPLHSHPGVNDLIKWQVEINRQVELELDFRSSSTIPTTL